MAIIRVANRKPGLSLRLLKVEPHLSKFGSLLRVHSGPQISFLQEIAPTHPSVFLALTLARALDTTVEALFYLAHEK